MSDEEYDDELPPISVNSSGRESGLMRMPPAEQLARVRAREAECERELRRLRADDPLLAAPDSSGSEGEAALAAAVTKLQMRGAARARAPPLPELLGALLARVAPSQHDALLALAPHHAAALADHVCEAALSSGAGGEAWGILVACACALSLAATARGPPRRARRARRALHQLLAHPPAPDHDHSQSESVCCALVEGVEGAALRLELADALAPVAVTAPLAARLQRRLAAAALADILHCEPPAEDGVCVCVWAARSVCAAWAQLEARAAAACLRAAGRVLRACPAPGGCGGARARLLGALQAPAPLHARHAPDRLEVLVGASKLQLLFRD